jgi:hypothetical protein
VLQLKIFKNAVVDKPTIAPVIVAKTNHFRILKKITDCSVSLRLIPQFSLRSSDQMSKVRKNALPLMYLNCRRPSFL